MELPGRLAEMQVSGMTDLQIVYEALANAGFTQDRFSRVLRYCASRLTEEARRVTGNGTSSSNCCPVCARLCRRCRDHPRYQSALLTGNIESMAHLKMELVGLDEFFTCPAHLAMSLTIRRDLPASAARTHS